MATKIIDLTQTLHPDIPVFPVYPKLTMFPWAKREVMGFQANAIFMVEHTGTHVDAPFHFYPKGSYVADVPPRRFVGDAVVLDFREKVPKGLISSEDLKNSERKMATKIRKGDKVLLHTGWDSHWGKGDYATSNAGISKDSAEFFVKRKVDLVGIDSANLDHPQDSSFPAHNTLLSNEVLIVENLCNLGLITKSRFTFIALPLKFKEGTGSPVRAVALIQ